MAFLCHSEVDPAVDSSRYIYLLFDILVFCATAFASNARCSDYRACAATHSARLLHIEWSLLHGLITCAAAATTLGRCGARLRLRTLARHADIRPIELDVLLGT